MPSSTRLSSYIVRLEKNGVQMTITVQNIHTREIAMFETYTELFKALEHDTTARPPPDRESGR
ncbi:hypothetical protein BH24DEI2_BH24DEI2_10350 [soil metagenome]